MCDLIITCILFIYITYQNTVEVADLRHPMELLYKLVLITVMWSFSETTQH